MRIYIAAFLLLLFSRSASAIAVGGSNFDIHGYPDHFCIRPTKPTKPILMDSNFEVGMYRSALLSYDFEFERYINCLIQFAKYADNDIERIIEKRNQAIEETNR